MKNCFLAVTFLSLGIANLFAQQKAGSYNSVKTSEFENIDSQINIAAINSAYIAKTKIQDSKKKKAVAMRKTFIECGLELRGTKYKLGGTTPETGMDCSGFVKFAAKKGLNKKLPRTADEMYKLLKPVKDIEREPGDLVFFKDSPYGKITHVGIYMGKYRGQGKLHGREIFLNSASAGPKTGVVVSALDEPYWKRTYHCTRRFLPQAHKYE